MPLLLKRVEAARGAHWLRDAFRLFLKRPLAFTALFAAFLFIALVAALLPVLGVLLQMMSPPLLSLGFMIATQSALRGGPVSPAQFVEPLRGDAGKRRSLLILCGLYGALAIGILLLCSWIAGDAGTQLQTLMERGDATPEELAALMADRGLTGAVLAGVVFASLLSVPFWHAPALVHWGSQGVAQALFSSTLAIWRCKGAFFVYALAWLGVCLGLAIVLNLVLALLGIGQLGPLLAAPLALMLTTVFYVSLLFTFNDSFGPAELQATPPRLNPPA